MNLLFRNLEEYMIGKDTIGEIHNWRFYRPQIFIVKEFMAGM